MQKVKVKTLMMFTGILLLIMFLSSCDDTTSQSKYRFILSAYGDGGWSKHSVYCDSVHMKTVSSADVWIDGIKIDIIAQDKIAVSFNQYFKQ